MKLTDTKVRNTNPADRDFRLADGGGLCLFVSTSGGKLWQYRYRFDGKGTPALVPFREAIRQQKDALLEIVAKRDRMFYGWIGNCCVLSRRFSTSLHHLRLSYEEFCVDRSAPAFWADFERLIRTEFEVDRRMVKGLSLKTDLDGYIPAARLQ